MNRKGSASCGGEKLLASMISGCIGTASRGVKVTVCFLNYGARTFLVYQFWHPEGDAQTEPRTKPLLGYGLALDRIYDVIF